MGEWLRRQRKQCFRRWCLCLTRGHIVEVQFYTLCGVVHACARGHTRWCLCVTCGHSLEGGTVVPLLWGCTRVCAHTHGGIFVSPVDTASRDTLLCGGAHTRARAPTHTHTHTYMHIHTLQAPRRELLCHRRPRRVIDRCHPVQPRSHDANLFTLYTLLFLPASS